MGNVSSRDKNVDIYSSVNVVASDLILKQSLKDMSNLNDSKYCDKLIVITSNVLNKKFSSKEISYIKSQIYGDNIVKRETKDVLNYVLKDDIENLDIKNKANKLEACKSISKFYIKIANLWYAILSTIKPVESSTIDDKLRIDNNQSVALDNNQSVALDNNQSVALDIETRNQSLYNMPLNREIRNNRPLNRPLNREYYGLQEDHRYAPMIGGEGGIESNLKQDVNFCDNRINILNNLLKETTKGYKVNKARLCKFKSYNLKQEPGIPELEKLYFDEYNKETGNLDKMSKKNQLIYKNDLETFYRGLVGKSLPNHIQKFSDINVNTISEKLQEYCNKVNNNNLNTLVNDDIFIDKANVSSVIFNKYGKAFNKLVINARLRKNQLVQIIDKLFVVNNIPLTNNTEIIINPKLNLNELDKLIVKARNIIINIYINCEKDFQKVNDIYSIIVSNYFPINMAKSNKTTKDNYYRYIENKYI